jgi:hypothetical protein
MPDKLGIPVGYLRRLREEHLSLYDANVNGWLERQPGRQLLLRTLRGQDAESVGVARAVLSERYGLHPPAHRHVVDLDTPLGQQLLHVAVRKAIAQVPADRHRDHLR